jgi:hypothetical protein
VHPQQRSLLRLNVVGGTAVLASYALAFALSPALRAGLWGGVPDALRPLYTACMLLAAVGYFPFTALLVFATPPDRPLVGGHPYRLLHLLYALILLPSAAWLPLTAAMLHAPDPLLWLAIRADLLGVALGSTGLLLVLGDQLRRRSDVLAWLALVGSVPFWVQTAILDALVWPAFFPP